MQVCMSVCLWMHVSLSHSFRVSVCLFLCPSDGSQRPSCLALVLPMLMLVLRFSSHLSLCSSVLVLVYRQ